MRRALWIPALIVLATACGSRATVPTPPAPVVDADLPPEVTAPPEDQGN